MNQVGKEANKRGVHISEPNIVNINGTVQLDQEMDLERYSEMLPCCEYIPEQFAALKLCNKNPYVTALIFRCGKIVCVGTVTLKMLINGVKWILDTLSQFEDEPIKMPMINIENIVATCKIPMPINLRHLSQQTSLNAHYEPEIFPGLSLAYHPKIDSTNEQKQRKRKYEELVRKEKEQRQGESYMTKKILELKEKISQHRNEKYKSRYIKVVLFQSGCVNIVGCKRMEDVKNVYQWLQQTINQPQILKSLKRTES